MKHVFVLVIFEGKHYKKKSGDCGTFVASFSFLFSLAQGGGLNISSLLLDYLFFLLSWSWMIEWVSPPRCCPSSFFSTRTLHTVTVAEIFHVRDVLECKTWIPPTPLTLVNFYPWEWFYELNHILLLVPKTTAVQVKLFCVHFILNRLPSLYYLQCTPA